MKSLKLIIALLLLSVFANGQNLKKAFKYLSNNDFDRAKVIFDEAVGIKDMAAIAHYGNSFIYSNRNYRSKDYYRAWDEIIKAETDFPQANKSLLEKLSSYFTGKADILKLKKHIDDVLFKQVTEANSITETEKFLAKAKLSAHYNDVKKLYAKQRFQQALEYNTINAFEDYIKEFPEATEVSAAKLKIYELAYAEVKTKGTLEAYKGFVEKYPEAPQVKEAQTVIIQKEYELVLLTGTDDAFDRFINKYPETEQAKELRAKQLQMSYIQAKQLNTVTVYNNFLKKFPASPYVAEITQLRDSLAFIEAKKLNTAEAYKDFVNKYPNAKQVPEVLAMQKDLSYSKAELKALKEKEKYASRNIKKVEFVKVDKRDTTKRKVVKTVYYDVYGNPVKTDEITIAGAHVVIERQYSDNGRNLLSEFKSVDGKPRYKVTFYYNDKELIDSARRLCYQPCEDGLPAGNFLFRYSYFPDRNVKEIVITNNEGTYLKKSTFKINNQKLVAQELVEITENGKTTNLKVNYQYDFYDHLIQKSTFSGENDISAVETYFYDKAGNVTKYSSYDAFGKIRKSNKYDGSGLLISTSVEYPNDSLQNHTIVYKYYFRE
jgi:TolA-binding protein